MPDDPGCQACQCTFVAGDDQDLIRWVSRPRQQCEELSAQFVEPRTAILQALTWKRVVNGTSASVTSLHWLAELTS